MLFFLLFPSLIVGKNCPISQIASRKVRPGVEPAIPSSCEQVALMREEAFPVPRYAIFLTGVPTNQHFGLTPKHSHVTPLTVTNAMSPTCRRSVIGEPDRANSPVNDTKTPSHRITTHPPPTIPLHRQPQKAQHALGINSPKTQIQRFPIRIVHTCVPLYHPHAPPDDLSTPSNDSAHPPPLISNQRLHANQRQTDKRTATTKSTYAFTTCIPPPSPLLYLCVSGLFEVPTPPLTPTPHLRNATQRATTTHRRRENLDRYGM